MNPSEPKAIHTEGGMHPLVSRDMDSTDLQPIPGTRSPSPKETSNHEDVEIEDYTIGDQTTLQRISKDYLKPNLGLVLLTVSYFFNSAMVVSTKVLENDPEDIANDTQIKPLQILLVRMVITYIGTLIYMYINKSTISDVPFGKPEVRKWLILRGCTGFFGVFGMYYSLMYLTISDAVLITFLSPSLTIFLSWLILRERFTRVEALGSLVSLMGVVLIVRPSFLFGVPEMTDSSSQIVESSDPRSRLIATLVGLWGVLGMSCVYIIIRYIGKRAHAIMSVSYFSLITALVSFIGINTIPSMKFQIPHSKKQWILFANLGISGFIFQLLLTLGIQRERAGRGSLMAYTQLIYAVFWDVALYKHWPNMWSWFGMIIIITATLWVIRIRSANNEAIAKDLTPILEDEENSIPLTDFDMSDSK